MDRNIFAANSQLLLRLAYVRYTYSVRTRGGGGGGGGGESTDEDEDDSELVAILWCC